MEVVKKLARNVLETEFGALGEQDIRYAKNRIIDVVGCALGGAQAAGNQAILDLVREWGGKPEATVLGHGIQAPAHHVAMVNSVMARSYDYEVSGAYVEGKTFPGHQPSVTVPTALTVAEHQGASGKELLAALILGDDTLSRITAAGDYFLDSPWDSAGTFNKFGAVAAAGRLWRLNESQMVNAWGIAVDTVASTFQSIWDGAQAFKLHGALACRDGIFSVELARKGFTGVKDPLFSRYGFFPVYCRTPNPEVLTRHLGKKFYSGSGIGHKPYPSCHSNHSAIECAWQIVQKHPFRPQEIDSVTLITSSRQVGSFLNQPYDDQVACQTKATFNLPYNVASVLLRKRIIRLEDFTEEAVRDPEVIELAKKVKLVASSESGTAISVERRMATEMKVKMRDGREFSAGVDVSKGRLGKELTQEEIMEKFRVNVAFSHIVAREKAEAALKMLDHLEEIDQVAQIIQLLR